MNIMRYIEQAHEDAQHKGPIINKPAHNTFSSQKWFDNIFKFCNMINSPDLLVS